MRAISSLTDQPTEIATVRSIPSPVSSESTLSAKRVLLKPPRKKWWVRFPFRLFSSRSKKKKPCAARPLWS